MSNIGIEIELPTKDHFNMIKETLTRIGMPGGSQDFPKLYQSCHILYRKKKYYIVHFKEMFILDGLPSSLSESDLLRRDTIINLLRQWNLLDVIPGQDLREPSFNLVKVLRKDESHGWELTPKYTIRPKKDSSLGDQFKPDCSPPKPGGKTWVRKIVDNINYRGK